MFEELMIEGWFLAVLAMVIFGAIGAIYFFTDWSKQEKDDGLRFFVPNCASVETEAMGDFMLVKERDLESED